MIKWLNYYIIFVEKKLFVSISSFIDVSDYVGSILPSRGAKPFVSPI